MSRVLEGAGYQTETVNSMSEAMAHVEAVKYDLFILDFWLKQENGLDVMRQLQRSQPETPVLFLSGGNESVALETTTALAEMQGAAEFLYKPVPNSALLDAIKRHIE